MIDVIDLSYFIIKRTNDNNNPISHLQLQKLLFFLQKMNLERNKVPLFKEKIYAWDFGTMIREVYNEFCVFSSLKIVLTNIEYKTHLEKISKIKKEVIEKFYQNQFLNRLGLLEDEKTLEKEINAFFKELETKYFEKEEIKPLLETI